MFDKLLNDKIIVFLDFLCIATSVMMLWIYKTHADIVLITFFILAVIVLNITKRFPLFFNLSLAFIIALIWNLIAKNQYDYDFHFIKIRGINIMPFFAWGMGLFGVYIIYIHFQKWFKLEKWYQRFLLFIILYWSLLTIIEYIAYHFMKLRDIATKDYKGLPFFDCIHAPVWMQISYFSLGLIYFISISYYKRLKIKNNLNSLK